MEVRSASESAGNPVAGATHQAASATGDRPAGLSSATSSVLSSHPIATDLQPTLAVVGLDDKYTATSGTIFLSGIQALVRLPMLQQWRDQAAGLNTAGFISGYRGSPLGGLDEALWKAQPHLAAHRVKFQPGTNEDMAATAVWGSQQVDLIGPARYDGVFAMWYGKGPGVDRCGDVLKHMNHAGTSALGGVLLVAGDDHGAYSSTLPHQSDHIFSASMIPMLYPCNVQEYLDLGLHGWAMSRFSGCTVGFKALADTVESSASVDADPFRVKISLPTDFVMPPGGLNARLSTETLGVQARKQEALMQDYKIYAALAYARANHLNRVMIDSPNARLGIIASGKSYLDVLEALSELGIDEAFAAEIGLRLFKVAMPWPLEPEGVREFAQGLDEILVVEEKRQMVEYQLKEQLYNWRDDVRPRVIGKFDEKGEWVAPRGEWLLTSKADFSVAQIARVIAARIARFHTSDLIKARLAFLDAKDAVLNKAVATPPRPAYYCSGCPHNTSTKVPEGSFALAGIGCHVMATAIYPEFNKLTTHMGGEGAPWIGQAPFSKVPHVFANLGDGTYFHSGSLAIRAALAAGVNITYKILYNDAVAMTGGQPVDGMISVPMMARQVAAEGVERIALVTEDLERYRDRSDLPANTTLHDRKDMDAVQRLLREVPGVSVLIYDQTCAAEKRRRRKKGEYPDPQQRMVINAAVCEGCGDCGVQSNCTSILPLETDFGRKRTIDQSSCNKDYSCVKGFCPSFVTVNGGKLKKSKTGARLTSADLGDFSNLPQPLLPSCATPFNILINGIGGTGVITVGALLGMAAHLEGKGASVLDMTGMSQKNGSVTSHVRIAATSQALRAQRIATGEADLILGCDMLTAGAHDAISKMRVGRTRAVVNLHQQPPGQFAKNPDWQFPLDQVRTLITEAVDGEVDFIDATRLATALMGDSIAANLFMLGYAWQRGAVPLSEAALLRAIEMNGVAVESNKTSFLWGRRAAVDLARVEKIAVPEQPVVLRMPPNLDQLIQQRTVFLTDYQDAAYAKRYTEVVERVRAAEAGLGQSRTLTQAVAQNLSKLMAYKDEYEVARLYTDGSFIEQLKQQFEGDFSLTFNLAPPLFSKKDAQGHLLKTQYGPWMFRAFRLLAKLKGLRGGWFDPFGHSAERKVERRLVEDYCATLLILLPTLRRDNLTLAVDIARLPEKIRGFGHVKDAAIALSEQQKTQLLDRYLGASLPAHAPVAA
ncbi:indolepyruvate ferredoxin oxidoreductase family protein [Herbaspirillum sp. RTI4]|uniref:indolepyruvate ferredoxin oxidoreductase family protein n=1 Tax=Herbaspirillum sp. RTI4 TaxID=3048640 RepID=UPI002AB5A7B1|nr:indolepyruvate ferredoxin oxidoreductase family protein [Herbaspirillum sp. RTI4]MDY7578856.1 indolepyruvate ferredoxin oxidoreductase family protein [Herbaspirillum sp. RTI4]MEA9982999.1 indolepyruvate ferredoxin oxidoreductase family protein [Herbaspirillum sp. RTI4]